VALEIRTSLRPERPGTTPKGDKRGKRAQTNKTKKATAEGGKEGEREPRKPGPVKTRGVKGKRRKTSKERRGEAERREEGKGHKPPQTPEKKKREPKRTTKTRTIFFVQRLHGFRQVVTHVQSRQTGEL